MFFMPSNQQHQSTEGTDVVNEISIKKIINNSVILLPPDVNA